jgi:hypothetical protein
VLDASRIPYLHIYGKSPDLGMQAGCRHLGASIAHGRKYR